MPPLNGKPGLSIEYTLDYGSPLLPVQHRTIDLDADSFSEQIAPARTFCLEAEAQEILGAGLGKGANTTNTLVVGDNGVIENELRFEDEFVRHKILDLIGDLYLLRTDLSARIVATRTGHRLNALLARRIGERMSELENRGIIKKDTGLDIREIMRILPHRYPFLFIDRVIEIEGYRRAVGIKNVSINEPFFQGHWPDQPIMPGVLQIEAMAQLAGVLLLRKLENTGKIAVLLSIEKVKLRRSVVPGDQLRVEAEALKVKSQAGKVKARVLVNGQLVSEAIMKFMLADA
jgi:UDP-3-O-[3-hydroxymyristoyl] N-acetylglucosamine deacetylase/3-hydroxyacyl-[acyl-carrier-protein] dehydratase